MNNPLSGRFTFSRLCNFAWPTVVMMIFMSLYTMVDGIFVANLVNSSALSAINIVYPALSLVYALGIMLATGSSAIVAKQLGQGKTALARENFTFMLMTAALLGLVLSWLGFAALDQMLAMLGATPEIYGYCRDYAGMLLWFLPLAVLQMMFQSYFVTAGKPSLGLVVVTSAGLVNIILDYVFIAKLGIGIGGAALATGIGYAIPSCAGLAYFALNRKGSLRFTLPHFRAAVLFSSCTNGSSEMVSNIALAIVTYLFNAAMLRYAGVDGVAAITIVLYAEYFLGSVFFGFSTGVAPLFSYKYGKQDEMQLRRLFKNSLVSISLFSVVSLLTAFALAGSIAGFFVPVGGTVYTYAVEGLRLHSLCFLFMGFNIFASALFTALSNGKISALLSFLRAFIFLMPAIIILPRFFGITGIWLAVPAAETLSMLVSAWCVVRWRTVYGYA